MAMDCLWKGLSRDSVQSPRRKAQGKPGSGTAADRASTRRRATTHHDEGCLPLLPEAGNVEEGDRRGKGRDLPPALSLLSRARAFKRPS